METDAKEPLIKQEIKEEEEVCFELVSIGHIKEEIVSDETEQVEHCFDFVDSKSCFVTNGIEEGNEMKQEDLGDRALNENMQCKEEQMNCEWSEPPLTECDPLALPEVQDVLPKLKIKNVNTIGKRKRYSLQEEDDTLQIAGSLNPEMEELNNDVFQRLEVMDTSELYKIEDILRKRELARERSRKYRKKKSMDLTENEETLRIRELSKERSRKYREKKRLKNLNSNVIHDAHIAEPSRSPDNTRLAKQLTILGD